MKKRVYRIAAIVMLCAFVALVSACGASNQYEVRIEQITLAHRLYFTAKSTAVAGEYAITLGDGEVNFGVYATDGTALFSKRLTQGENKGILQFSTSPGAALSFVFEGEASDLQLRMDAKDLLVAAATALPRVSLAPAATLAPEDPNGGWRFGG